MTGNAIREALEPFARAATGVGAIYRDEDRVSHTPHVSMILTVGDLRRARTAYDAIGSGVKAEHIEAFRTVLESVLKAETSGARSPAVDFEARRFIRDHGAAILASLSPDDASAADAEIGRDFLNAIEPARDEYPWLANWTPAERYGELVGDLLNIAFPGSASSDIVRDVVRKAILFSDWAAGEGICSSNPHIADPADFMSRLYVSGGETPDAIADAAISCLSTHTEAGDRTRLDLGNLLAIIHRDGGHYELEHGTAKAVEEAHRIIGELLDHTAAEAVGRIEVVPLEWDHEEEVSKASSAFDDYQVFAHGDYMPGRWTTGSSIGRDFGSREEAVAAVEENYRTKALEAVVLVHPVEPGEVKRDEAPQTDGGFLTKGERAAIDKLGEATALRRELAEARGLIRDAIGLVPLGHQNWHTDARTALGDAQEVGR